MASPSARTSSRNAAPTYRIRLDNLLLALVVVGLLAAAVPVVYGVVAGPGTSTKQLKADAASATAPAAAAPTNGATLSPAAAVAQARTLLAHGDFDAAMALVQDLTGPEADAADASGMRDEISSAQTRFTADIAAMRAGAASGDWQAVADAAEDARAIAGLPNDVAPLAERARTEVAVGGALTLARAAIAAHDYPKALDLARAGFHKYHSTSFKPIILAAMAGMSAKSSSAGAAAADAVMHQSAHAVASGGGAGGAAASHASSHASSHHAASSHSASRPPSASHGTHSAGASHAASTSSTTWPAMTEPATTDAVTGSGGSDVTVDELAALPQFAGMDEAELTDMLAALGPNAREQLADAGIFI